MQFHAQWLNRHKLETQQDVQSIHSMYSGEDRVLFNDFLKAEVSVIWSNIRFIEAFISYSHVSLGRPLDKLEGT